MTVIDATGHRCPMPVLFLQRALSKAQAGDSIELISSDPASVGDVPRYCDEGGLVCEILAGETAPYRFKVIAGSSKS